MINRERTMKVLTVANRKGGAGKSTCAAHLSFFAAAAGLKTILIDLDPQKTLENWWQKRSDDNPYLTDVLAKDMFLRLKGLTAKGFDLCIVDTPGDDSMNAMAGIKYADLVLIPCKPTGPDLAAIGRTISFLQDQEKTFVFVVTQSITRSSAALQAASVLSEFGPVAPTTVPDRVAYVHAMTRGMSASEIDKQASGELKNLWEFVAKKLALVEDEHVKEKV